MRGLLSLALGIIGFGTLLLAQATRDPVTAVIGLNAIMGFWSMLIIYAIKR
jgi:hypothetical protein